MHRLYWKIFVTFWLSLVFFVGATLFSASFYLEQTRSRAADENPRLRQITLVREASEIAALHGTEGLKQWLTRLDRSEVTPHYLIDEAGGDLLGRSIPPDLAFRLERERLHMSQMSGMRMRPHAAIRVSDGREFRLIPDFKGVNLWRVLGRPRVIALPLVVTALLSGLLCYWLARHLLLPVEQLREATRGLASGDLGRRVAPRLGDRRDEIADLAHDFDHMAERIEQLMASQIQLLGDISHELRSPLARLVVALELEQKKREGPSSGELERIGLEAERMNELIGQILAVTRMESGARIINYEVLDINVLLKTLVENCNFEIGVDDKSVAIVESEPTIMSGDAALITSALENVIRNAAYYTEPGTQVEIVVQCDGKRLEIRVRDHGPGVPEAMLERLFDPFVRVGDARDRGSGGHGLGLAIAQRAIMLHGGDIGASNRPGGGLQISIGLPLSEM